MIGGFDAIAACYGQRSSEVRTVRDLEPITPTGKPKLKTISISHIISIDAAMWF
jgi:hypothetical protein